MTNDIIEVPENERTDVLPHIFGKKFLRGEALVYDFTRTYCPDYNGGEWSFYVCDDDALFMACPELGDNVTLRHPVFGEMKTDFLTAGLLMTFKAVTTIINEEIQSGDAELLSQLFYNRLAMYEVLCQMVGGDLLKWVMDIGDSVRPY